jgi:hypothetical protein
MSKCLAIVVATPFWLAAVPGDEGGRVPGELTAAERATIRDLAERALKERDLIKGKVYLTRIEVFPDSGGTRRHVTVTHYRYDGDLAIQTSIDLIRKEVTDVETIPHLPTSLAPEEVVEAEKLARANVEVARALARYEAGGKIEVDAVIVRTAIEDDPRYHHRTVRLAFRRGRDYLLHVPFVEVDLTAGTVRVQPLGKAHD